MNSAVFVDTWAWICLANKKEPRHEEVKRFYLRQAEREGDIVTTDYVLDELITFLFSRCPTDLAIKYLQRLFLSIEKGFVCLEGIDIKRFQKAWALRVKYKDKPGISFTDLTSFVVMKELGLETVATNDRHFHTAQLGFHLVP